MQVIAIKKGENHETNTPYKYNFLDFYHTGCPCADWTTSCYTNSIWQYFHIHTYWVYPVMAWECSKGSLINHHLKKTWLSRQVFLFNLFKKSVAQNKQSDITVSLFVSNYILIRKNLGFR